MYLAPFYDKIYLLVVCLCTLSCVGQYATSSPSYCETSSNRRGIVLLLALFFTFFIGLRPIGTDLFGDSAAYLHTYEAVHRGIPFVFDFKIANVIFDNLLAFFASYDLGLSLFFLLCATVYFGAAYIGIKRLFPTHCFPAYLTFLAAFSTFSYATNGIKAGMAASVFIMALSYARQWKICLGLMLLAYGCHHSMRVPIAAYILTLIIKSPKLYFYGWLICLLMVASHITVFQTLLAKVGGGGYLEGRIIYDNPHDRGGFRADFIAYSIMPIWVGYIAIFKKKISSYIYNVILCVYLTTNAFWLLCMYALFTNRIAYLSWFLYPIVLIYPLFLPQWGEKRYQTLSIVMLAHLGFTIFMSLVYYA